MDTVDRLAGAVGRVVRSRWFAASALAVVSAVLITAVALNMNAVTVVAGDVSRVVLTLDDNPHRALSSAGVTLNEGDEVLSVNGGDVVRVSRAFDVQVTADGITTVLRMTDGTVAEALERANVTLGEFDRLNEEADAAVSAGMAIRVDRVEYEEYTETETVAYTSAVQYTGSLARGKTQVKQAGEDGVKTLTYRKCIENGEVVGTELVDEEITTPPVQEIILKGTSTHLPVSEVPYELELDAKGQPVNYTAVYSGSATAYTNDRGLAGNYTASGRKAGVGVVAVNPNIIPYGTELYIVSADGSWVYGYAIAGDTGGALMSGHCIVDLFFETWEECSQFGRRNMNVYVIG
ncbi:MAG TPA: G5 domain-containing protein [Firmicutes bacterium]|nr:G5 domain-containing protein [Bacillota bacterium]